MICLGYDALSLGYMNFTSQVYIRLLLYMIQLRLYIFQDQRFCRIDKVIKDCVLSSYLLYV